MNFKLDKIFELHKINEFEDVVYTFQLKERCRKLENDSLLAIIVIKSLSTMVLVILNTYKFFKLKDFSF